VHRGPTIKVQLRFHRAIAAVIKERSWHPSQQFRDRTDGSVVMTLDVCDDYALRSWILGSGRLVRVIAQGRSSTGCSRSWMRRASSTRQAVAHG
jgi:WYL domain